MRLTRVATLKTGMALCLLSLAAAAPANAKHHQEDPPNLQGTYVVVYKEGASTSRANRDVGKAKGTVVYNYHQISVVIASSDSPTFDENMRKTENVIGVLRPTAASLMHTSDDAVLPKSKPGRNGSLWKYQWDMRQIGVEEAHQVTEGSRNVLVGVLDTGVDGAHPNLAPNFDSANSVSCLSGAPDQTPGSWEPSVNVDGSDHGTHVAGTIAAAHLKDQGIVGIAPNVRVASVKVVDDEGLILAHYAICGMMWAASQGMDVTNNSYFVDPWKFNEIKSAEEMVIWDAVERAIAFSHAQGVLHIASAGNDNLDVSKARAGAAQDIPTEAPGVIGVSSVGVNHEKASYSSFGLGIVDVTAPGGDTAQRAPGMKGREGEILSTVAGGKYDYMQGTSMAGPHAAGVAALIKSQFPFLTADEVGMRLMNTSDHMACPPKPSKGRKKDRVQRCIGTEAFNGFFGHGEVNALRAVSE